MLLSLRYMRSKARTLFSKTLLPQPGSHHLHIFSILLLVLLCSWILLIFCFCYPKQKEETSLSKTLSLESKALTTLSTSLLRAFQCAPYFHPFHWEPEHTDQSAEFTREAGIQGHRRHAAQGNSMAYHWPLIGWKSNSPFWVIALSRQQASFLAPIHQVHNYC